MPQPSILTTQEGRDIAYHQLPGGASGSDEAPGVVFLGGFMSDMTGTKAQYLHAWAAETGRAFLRFDYSGHGASSGAFADGAIGDWADDAAAVVGALTRGPQILVGSSMGGWISLLLARRMPERVAGLVTIAAAPDFTEDGFWESFSEAEKDEVMENGGRHVPSDYGAPYWISRRLIEDGRENFVLRTPLHLPMPTRFLQGTADADVPMSRATTLLDHATGPDIRLTAVKGADHSFSGPAELMLIRDMINEVTQAIA